MKKLIACLLSLALVVVIVPVMLGDEPAEPARNRNWFEVFREDWENGGQGWTLEDLSGGPSAFHVSTYYAYDDGAPPNHSYWCGSFEHDANGGYGSGWHEILELPQIDLTGATQPRIRFRYRHDSESGDATWIEAKQGGVYVKLSSIGYDGSSTGWRIVPAWGIDLQGCDNPLEVRFRFRSDVKRSDEDGYDTDGGAFHVDEIRVYELGGEDYFYDDVEDGVGLCTPVDTPFTGIVPRLIELPCRAYSDPTCVNINPPGDTTYVPPHVFVRVTSPLIHLEGAEQGTLHYAGAHCGDGDPHDRRAIHASFDGGATWVLMAWNNYLLEEVDGCDQFSPHGLPGYDISDLLPANSLILRISVCTDDDGIGPGVSGAGGSFLDDVWVNVQPWTAVPEEEISWGRIKGLYR